MSSILEEIETKIEGLKTSTTKSNVGVVRETGDGVARIEGLSDVMLNEMIGFPKATKLKRPADSFQFPWAKCSWVAS
jgi:F0F1-type ATP synthase alpha subunit